MCLPPADINSSFYFKEMNLTNTSFGLSELSMGMSSDYIEALKKFCLIFANWIKYFW